MMEHSKPFRQLIAESLPGAVGDCRGSKRTKAIKESEAENTTVLSATDLSFITDDLNHSPTGCSEHSTKCKCYQRGNISGASTDLHGKLDFSLTSQLTALSDEADLRDHTTVDEVSSSNIVHKLRDVPYSELNIEQIIELERTSNDYYIKSTEWDDENASYWRENLDDTTAIRATVYAEPYDPEKESLWSPPIHPKTEKQRLHLILTVKDILLFRELDSIEMRQIIDAMALKEVEAGDTIIEEGDDGDYFYVVDSGVFEAYMTKNGVQKLVKTYSGSGNFGELSLLYDVPRAATVKAVTNGTLWALDRQTFRTLVLQAAYKKREMYESLIANVPILKELEPYERMSLADALVPKTYAKGTKIINQGDEANGMYFIVDGYVRITVKDELDNDIELKVLGPGQYFGELALLTQKPRAASAIAAGFVKLAFLDKGGFERLLGPCLQIMERNITNYERETKQFNLK